LGVNPDEPSFENGQAGLIQGIQRERAGGQQAIQRILVAAFDDKQPIDPIDGLVFRHNQAADVTLEFDERFGRKDIDKEWRILLNHCGKCHQRNHVAPPGRYISSWIVQRFSCVGVRQLEYSVVKVHKSRMPMLC